MLATWADGRLLGPGEPGVVPTDPGFTLGRGLFETLRVDDGVVLARQAHLERLRRSVLALGFPRLDHQRIDDGIAAVLQSAAARAAGCSARLRYTVTAAGGCVVTLAAMPPPIHEATVVTAAWPRNEHSPLVGHKTTSYFESALAMEQAQAGGASEALFRNTRGDYCEGATSNLFVVDAGRVITPPEAAGLLPGVTRALVMQHARSLGLEVTEQPVSAELLDASDELFLTSSLKDICPVTSLDGRPLRVGEVTRQLLTSFTQPAR